MTIRVYFVGVCTHIKRDHKLTPWLDVPHRVVMIQAREGRKDIEGHPIPPHITTIEFDGQEIELQSMTVSVVTSDMRPPHVRYDKDSYPHVPKLRDYAPEDLTPDPDVVQNRDASYADVYFDVDRGTFRGCCAHKSAAVELTIEVDDPTPILRLTPWCDRLQRIDYPLTPDSIICVRHIAQAAEDEKEDEKEKDHFLLHSGIAGRLRYFPVPGHISCEGQIEHCLPNSLGPGCSDSSYP